MQSNRSVRTNNRIRGLDGRPIFCRAEHASLNYLLQSAGAILSKRFVVIGQDMIDEAGLTYDRDYTRCAYVHDEVQFSVIPTEADTVARLLEQAALRAGEYYKFRVPITAAADVGDNWAATTNLMSNHTFNFVSKHDGQSLALSMQGCLLNM